nr:MAG TPA: hypothetical protein [Crassvirales sp.]DAR56523.1 MAG TPA: hypothetical protein [Crassvirales sp.]
MSTFLDNIFDIIYCQMRHWSFFQATIFDKGNIVRQYAKLHMEYILYTKDYL